MHGMNEKNRKYRSLKNDLEKLDTGPKPEEAPPDPRIGDSSEDDLSFLYTPEEARPPEPALREKIGRGVRNFLGVLLCLVITGLWYYDWNVSDFVNRTSDFVTSFIWEAEPPGTAPAPDREAGLPPLPELPEMPADVESELESAIAGGGEGLEMAMADYVAALDEAGYRELFSMPAIAAFYQAGVTMDYLDRLNEAGFLQDHSFPEILTFFSSGVTVDYLVAMRDRGYLERFGYPAVAALSSSGVTVDYLDGLRERGLLEDLTFSDILIMHSSE